MSGSSIPLILEYSVTLSALGATVLYSTGLIANSVKNAYRMARRGEQSFVDYLLVPVDSCQVVLDIT